MEWSILKNSVLSNSTLTGAMINSIVFSYQIAFFVALVDLIFGLPLGWAITRGKFKGRQLVDTLLDMPLALPTAATGFSTAIFWQQLTNTGNSFAIVSAIHIAISLPYMVRSVSAAIQELDVSYEIAARTLGASPRDVFFDIELPLSAKGILTGAILCWARAISEFGAVIILAYYPHTAPVLIYVRFETWGLSASKPISALLLIVTLSIFILLKYIEKKSD